jgi:hypothetical protein
LGQGVARFEQTIPSDGLAHLVYLALAVTTTTALSAVSFHGYELSFLCLKDRFAPHTTRRLVLQVKPGALTHERVQ